MAEVDTSFYNQPQPGQNLLSGIGQTVGVANALTQNRALNAEANMLQSQYGSNQAVGRAFQASIDPNTGLPDPVKLNNLLASDPAAAYGAPAAFQNSATLQGSNLANAATSAANAQGAIAECW
jgi:hypothetical protein